MQQRMYLRWPTFESRDREESQHRLGNVIEVKTLLLPKPFPHNGLIYITVFVFQISTPGKKTFYICLLLHYLHYRHSKHAFSRISRRSFPFYVRASSSYILFDRYYYPINLFIAVRFAEGNSKTWNVHVSRFSVS